MAVAATLRKPKEEAERPPPIGAAARPPVGVARSRDPARSSVLPAGATSSSVVEISSSTFAPPQAVVEEIAASGSKGLDVRVIARGLTQEGLIKVRQNSLKKFVSNRNGSMPLLNPWTDKLGGMHLNFGIVDSTIKEGYASLNPHGGGKNDWLKLLRDNSALLGGLGLKIKTLPKPVNIYDGAKLVMGVTGAEVVVGGYVDAQFDLLLENMATPMVSGSAEISVGGAAKGNVKFSTTGERLQGSVTVPVTLTSFSGSINIVYKPDGTVDIAGKAAYNANKLSGEIQFVATDPVAANKFAKDAIAAAGGPENVQNAAAPAPVPVAKEGQKKRALAATGRLNFNLTKWFAGTVNVVVDSKGEVTVIGKIAPPAEITLFQQRDWPPHEIVKLEAKAYYGIPVVGNLNLFANISLHAIAKLGPATLRAIEIIGTYSTDPEVQKTIQISGSLNISAYGGLRLRAEGGAGITILKHDLKFGIGLNADVGVKAYADARPTIGYRDPGIFYISGTLDLVAQPMLGLSGEFFIALDAPWFSPLDDDRWAWPLFSKEWPLGDPIGISATLKEYVLGSGKVPEITMKPPEFDPSKFMTNMVDDKLPNKSGGKGAGQGTFKDDGSIPKPVVPPKKPAPKVVAKPSKKGPKLTKSKSGVRDAKADNGAKSTEVLVAASKPLEALKGKPAMARGDLDKELAKIKTQVSGLSIAVASLNTKWSVTPKVGVLQGRSILIAAKIGMENETPKDGELGETLTFTAEGGGHRLWVDKGENAELMLASIVKPLTKHLSEFKADAAQLDPVPKASVLAAISDAMPIAEDIATMIKQAKNKKTIGKERDDLDTKIEVEERKLVKPLKVILDTLEVRVPDVTKLIDVKFIPAPAVAQQLVEYDRQLKRQEAQINKMTVHIWFERRKQFQNNKAYIKKADKKARQNKRDEMKEMLWRRFKLPWHPANPPALVKRIERMTGMQAIVDSFFVKAPIGNQKGGFSNVTAYENAENGLYEQDVLHEPDKIAGGRYDAISDVGLGEVNSDIGDNWFPLQGVSKPHGGLAMILEREVEKDMKKKKVSRAFWRKPKMNVNLNV